MPHAFPACGIYYIILFSEMRELHGDQALFSGRKRPEGLCFSLQGILFARFREFPLGHQGRPRLRKIYIHEKDRQGRGGCRIGRGIRSLLVRPGLARRRSCPAVARRLRGRDGSACSGRLLPSGGRRVSRSRAVLRYRRHAAGASAPARADGKESGALPRGLPRFARGKGRDAAFVGKACDEQFSGV